MSSTLERATEALQAQWRKGIAKYDAPLESSGHGLTALLVHKQEEMADALMYTTEAIERARELEAENEALKARVETLEVAIKTIFLNYSLPEFADRTLRAALPKEGEI